MLLGRPLGGRAAPRGFLANTVIFFVSFPPGKTRCAGNKKGLCAVVVCGAICRLAVAAAMLPPSRWLRRVVVGVVIPQFSGSRTDELKSRHVVPLGIRCFVGALENFGCLVHCRGL